MTAAEPSLCFTADQGWHLQGGALEQLVQRREHARAEHRRHRQLAREAALEQHRADTEIQRLARGLQ